MDISTLAPVSESACLPCIAEVAGVSTFWIRSWTQCAFHYMEWSDEKNACDVY